MIDQLLHEYRYFQECVILEVRFRDYQSTLEIVLNYIWDEVGNIQDKYGNIRTNLDEEERIVVRLGRVQEVRFKNNLNEVNLLEPEYMNWSINEISWMRLKDDDELLEPYRDLPVEFHDLTLLWENERRIDVVFADLEIVKETNSQ